MSRPIPEYGETWAYESIVGGLPGLDLRGAPAVAVQVGLFESLVLAFGFYYGIEQAILPGTVAVVVAGVGSVAMLRLSGRVRASAAPEFVVRALFGSSVEVVLSLLSFVGLLTYLFVYDPRAASDPLLYALLGGEPPLAAVFVTLLVLWDLCYRIGTSWWTAVVVAWAVLRRPVPPEALSEFRSVSRLNVGFGWLQLALLPFVLDRPVLALALAGHVLAVTLVSGYVAFGGPALGSRSLPGSGDGQA